VSRRSGEVLVGGLDAAVPAGARVLVTGPEEAQLALFRATAGLWESGQGRIVRPPAERVHFVPERPYLPPGTLREALLRTGRESEITDAELFAVLQALELDAAVARLGGLDVELEWDDVLSLAEQQLCAVARVRLAAPTHALLQSPSPTLGPEALGRALRVLSEASIACVVFGGDEGVLAYDALLEIAPGGAWKLASRQRQGAA
jgi:putative ATP-binding cassette transporter